MSRWCGGVRDEGHNQNRRDEMFCFHAGLLSIEEPDSGLNYKNMNLRQFYMQLLIQLYHIVLCQVILLFFHNNRYFCTDFGLKMDAQFLVPVGIVTLYFTARLYGAISPSPHITN